MSENNDFQKFLEQQRAKRAAEAARDVELRERKAKEKEQAEAIWPKLGPILRKVVGELQAPDLYDLDIGEERKEHYILSMHFAIVGSGGSRSHRQRNGNGAMQLAVVEGRVKLKSRVNERFPMADPSTGISQFNEQWLRDAMGKTIQQFFHVHSEGRAL